MKKQGSSMKHKAPVKDTTQDLGIVGGKPLMHGSPDPTPSARVPKKRGSGVGSTSPTPGCYPGT